jgi:hypothetical protein
MGVVIEPAVVQPGQWYWRLIKARWQDENESGNDHTIYVEVLDENGGRLVGHPVEYRWPEGIQIINTEDKPAYEYPSNFPMYGTLGSYGVRVGGLPSETIVGLGMGSAEYRDVKLHTNFFLTFQKVQK